MAETFQDRLDSQDRIGGDSADISTVAHFNWNSLSVRHVELMKGVRATSDKSEWIFVGNAVQVWVTVTRAANSAGEAADVVVSLRGFFGAEKPADSEDGVQIQAVPAGENNENSLEIFSGGGPMPMWFRATITTAVTDNNDYVDVNAKIVSG